MISILHHKTWQGDTYNKIEIVFEIDKNPLTVFFEFLWIQEKHDIIFDFLLPPLLFLGIYAEQQIDMGWRIISYDAITYCDKIITYCKAKDDIHTTFNDIFKNYTAITYNNKKNDKRTKGLFFSWGVDSLYSLYKNINDIDLLFFVVWYDIHYNDLPLVAEIQDTFLPFLKKTHKNLICVRTNIRELTEFFVNRELVYGPCLSSIWILWNQFNHTDEIIISSAISNTEPDIWSDENIQKLLWLWSFSMNHFWANISRIEKIQYLQDKPYRTDIVRVCRENIGWAINCWWCEKCTRALLEFDALWIKEKINSFKNKYIHTKHIEIKSSNFMYYEDIIKKIKEDEIPFPYASEIQNKLDLYHRQTNHTKKWEKKKNIIFIDFNGVISLNTFRNSWKTDNKKDFDTIQHVLFKERLDLVQLRMKWKKSSEDIANFLDSILDSGYEEILSTLKNDCEHIDISKAILKSLEELKNYYHIILITDNMDCFYRRTIPSNKDMFEIFDDIWDSFRYWYFKKEYDWKAFSTYVENFQSQIENCYLIDDSENNCKAFSLLWWKAIHISKWEDVTKRIDSIKEKTHSKRLWQI